MIQKCKSSLKKVPMLPFTYTILLRCIGTGCLMDNAMGGKKLKHWSINKFPSIIRPKHFYFDSKLIFYHVFEVNKGGKNLCFWLKGIYPGKSWEIINKKNIIPISIYWKCGSWTPNITMYNFQRTFSTANRGLKGNLWLLDARHTWQGGVGLEVQGI